MPPVPIRPSVAMDVGGGSTEDGLTTQLSEIIRNNNLMQVGSVSLVISCDLQQIDALS